MQFMKKEIDWQKRSKWVEKKIRIANLYDLIAKHKSKTKDPDVLVICNRLLVVVRKYESKP